MTAFFGATGLVLVLLNPFLVIVYLTDVVEKLNFRAFSRVLIRAAVISSTVFCAFAVVGDTLFSRVMHLEFASFQIFGGIVFLLIGIQFVFRGGTAIEVLRGESEHLAGAIAMPVLIGPGTISASILVGQRLSAPAACGAVVFAVAVSVLVMLWLKRLHDYVRPRREPLVQRYVEVAGRITALLVGTVSVEMIMRGVRTWIGKM